MPTPAKRASSLLSALLPLAATRVWPPPLANSRTSRQMPLRSFTAVVESRTRESGLSTQSTGTS